MRRRSTAAVAVGSVLLVACGSSTHRALRRPNVTARPATASTAHTTTTTSSTTTTTPPSTIAAPTRTAPTHAAVTTPTTTAPLIVTRIAGLGAARQVVVVTASAYGSTAATLSAYQRGANGWTTVFGPWSADIGRNGVAPVGAKREGDGRTPSGVFGFDFVFGFSDPGVRYPFRRITGTNIVWDDDSASPNYNEWVDTSTASAGASPEPMDVAPYRDGIVIGYNDARTPGLGSGIFLHVTHYSPTSGCVSLPQSELLEVLRWLDPAQSPRIAIGTRASLTS